MDLRERGVRGYWKYRTDVIYEIKMRERKRVEWRWERKKHKAKRNPEIPGIICTRALYES